MDEEGLVIEAQRGNQDAFGRLVALRSPDVYRLCMAILRSSHDAEDAAQDAFVTAWRELPRLRSPKAWAGWVKKIAVRSAIETDRRRRRHRRPLAQAAVTADAAAEVVDHVTLELVLQALPIEERAILALRFYLDLDVPQIAATLDIPLGTAKSRLHRAVGHVRSILGTYGDEQP